MLLAEKVLVRQGPISAQRLAPLPILTG